MLLNLIHDFLISELISCKEVWGHCVVGFLQMKGLSSEAPVHSSAGAQALPMAAFSGPGYSYFMAIEVPVFKT